MLISEKTKISALIKANPDAIEAIASISSHFEKLRNPLLRKILASRVTIADAARIGNTTSDVFFTKLMPLGFITEAMPATPEAEPADNTELPVFLKELPAALLRELDVRLDILSGNDPFQKIIAAVEAIPEGGALCLINTFEPTPLIAILKKRGLSFYTENLGPDLVHTYFFKEPEKPEIPAEPTAEAGNSEAASSESFEEKCAAFAGRIRETDVRNMEMPLPMVTILNELETLPKNHALFVHHKRVPQMLLPQLQERGFTVKLRELSEGEVKLLIYASK